MQISKNNYIRATSSGSTFDIIIDSLPAKFDNYFIESCKAAEEIYNLKQGKLHLLYSGGVDSEYALKVFLHLKMDVVPVIINLNPSYNDFDIAYAIKFCNKNKIDPLIINLDFDNF